MSSPVLLNLSTAPETRDALRAAARALRVKRGLTQADLAARSGVALGSLKRFEQTGEIGLTALLRLAEVLDALGPFHALFPLPEAGKLDELDPPTRASRVRRGDAVPDRRA